METDDVVDTFKEDRKALAKLMCDEDKFLHSAEFANEMTSDQLIEYDQEKVQKHIISQVLKNINEIFPDSGKRNKEGLPFTEFSKRWFFTNEVIIKIAKKQIQMHFAGESMQEEVDSLLRSIIVEFEKENYFQSFDDPEKEDDLVFIDRRTIFYKFLADTIRDN